jgi:CheY-like chemotaxis protein
MHMTDTIEADGQSIRVLIADDDPNVVQFLADRCTKMGFEVQIATNGVQAAIMARQSRPQILITDVSMPGLDGLALCHRLLGPKNRSLEAIVITGKLSPETEARCDAFGAIYARKGPDMWNIIRSALVKFIPDTTLETADLETSAFQIEIAERPRILVIDDDADVGRLLGSRLRKAGVDPLFAPDGSLGYRIACREKPSVIISDYFMPNGDANYLLWRLRNTPATQSTPVFVISGRALDDVTKANLTRGGVARFFLKPFDIDELFQALQQYCALDYKSGKFQLQ